MAKYHRATILFIHREIPRSVIYAAFIWVLVTSAIVNTFKCEIKYQLSMVMLNCANYDLRMIIADEYATCSAKGFTPKETVRRSMDFIINERCSMRDIAKREKNMNNIERMTNSVIKSMRSEMQDTRKSMLQVVDKVNNNNSRYLNSLLDDAMRPFHRIITCTQLAFGCMLGYVIVRIATMLEAFAHTNVSSIRGSKQRRANRAREDEREAYDEESEVEHVCHQNRGKCTATVDGRRCKRISSKSPSCTCGKCHAHCSCVN